MQYIWIFFLNILKYVIENYYGSFSQYVYISYMSNKLFYSKRKILGVKDFWSVSLWYKRNQITGQKIILKIVD